MKYLPLILILVCSVVLAQPINEKYSYKAFPYYGVSFKDRPASEFNNTTIRGTMFYQAWREGEEVVKDIFPDGMKGVVFERCNLDNVYIPDGNILRDDPPHFNTHLKIQMQNDREDWILDDDLKPVKPMDKEQRLKAGIISIDPKNIPKKKITIKQRRDFERLIDSLNP